MARAWVGLLAAALVSAICTQQAVGMPWVGAMRGMQSIWDRQKPPIMQRALQEEDKCPAILEAVLPKVALMFLVLGEMPHEAVWVQWLGGVAGKLPAKLACNPEALACYEAMPRGANNAVYDSQVYYTMYMHTKPEFAGYPEGSLFYNRTISTLIPTAWGDHSLAAALRLLTIEALRDPLNQQFQLLCPATIPLRPALFTYTQLMGQPKSRVGWYFGREGPIDHWAYRFPVSMVEELPAIEGHTRFHRQFVTLIRKHAAVVATDDVVHPLFQRHCFIAKEQHGHWCVSDEQYVGTVLSYHLSEDEFRDEITGDLAVALATSGTGFAQEVVSTELIIQLRGSRKNNTLLPDFEDHKGECHAVERLNLTIVDMKEQYYRKQHCAQFVDVRGSTDMPTHVYENCPYFARKFKERTVESVHSLLEKLMII